MKRRSLAALGAIAMVLGIAMYILWPSPYECSWREMGRGVSPAGNKLALLYERQCQNGSPTSLITDNLFLVEDRQSNTFQPDDHSRNLIVSVQASSVEPRIEWMGERPKLAY